MSTKAIREALEWAERKTVMTGADPAWLAAARAELEAIDIQAKARRFHETLGDTLPTSPTMPTPAVRALRCRLLLEEALEVCAASGVDVFAKSNIITSGKEVDVEANPYATPDLASMARENADVFYIVAGTACVMGVDLAPVFNDVHEANMRKFPGGVPRRRADGKVLKPEGWHPPDVAGVLAKQGPK